MSRCDHRAGAICGFLDALRVCLTLALVLFNCGLLPAPGLENVAEATRVPCTAPSGARVSCPGTCGNILGTCTVTAPLQVTGLTTTCVWAFGVCGPGTFDCLGTLTAANNPANLGAPCKCSVSGKW